MSPSPLVLWNCSYPSSPPSGKIPCPFQELASESPRFRPGSVLEAQPSPNQGAGEEPTLRGTQSVDGAPGDKSKFSWVSYSFHSNLAGTAEK